QRGRLTRLLRRVHLVEPEHFTLPRGVRLPGKDLPILLAAIDGGATHLLTGDWEHFGPYFRQEGAGTRGRSRPPRSTRLPAAPRGRRTGRTGRLPQRGSPGESP